MTNSKHTKRALFSSVVALLLCFTMLMGATFAWFTDNVSSTGNRIQAGDLEVDLVMYKDGAYSSIAGGVGDIFSEAGDGVWEPGKTQVVYLGVQNKGNLALKYNILLNIIDNGLVGSLEYAIIDGVQHGDITLTSWDDVKIAANGQTDEITAGEHLAAQGGVLDDVADDPSLTGDKGETDFFALAVHMKEEATNDFENGTVTIDVVVNATQKDAEEDSFGSDYDAGAEFEDVAATALPDNTSGEIKVGDVTVTIPAESGAGSYELKVSKKTVTESNGDTEANYDISLYKDGVAASGVTFAYPVEIQLPTFLNITKLTHNGNEITNYNYDMATGLLTFETNSFSPFVVEYTSLGESIEMEGDKIVAGTFRGVDPKTLDSSLAETDSEYIAVAYEEDGEECYVVSPRATTVVVSASDATTFTELNYDITAAASGKLASIFASAPDNANVFLLPGTYNEATTITVNKNCNIVGLGDKGDILVKKIGAVSTTTTKPSNRHLFNCNGQKSDYIQVTIRNLTLDATEQNKYKTIFFGKEKDAYEDNAAVQSIRRTKVKCYDLNIIKEANNSGSCAFYANGKNKVKDEAGNEVVAAGYLYIENCSVNNAQKMGVIEWQPGGDSLVYYNNVTYNNGQSNYDYTNTYIKNIAMDATDWEW